MCRKPVQKLNESARLSKIVNNDAKNKIFNAMVK